MTRWQLITSGGLLGGWFALVLFVLPWIFRLASRIRGHLAQKR